MKMIVSGYDRLSSIWYGFWAMMIMMLAAPALAQSGTDPVAPLEILKTARDKANNSNMNTNSIKTTMENIAGLLVILGGVIGLGAALYGLVGLYNNVHKGEQARGSNTQYIIATIVGSTITIVAIIVASITNIFVSS